MTVIISLSYSLIYFVAFVHVLGPEYKEGDVPTWWRGMRAKCKAMR